MTEVAVYFNADEETFAGSFADLHAQGYRLQSVSIFGHPFAPTYAGLWHQTWGPDQEFVGRIPLVELDAVVAAQRGEQRFPALVSGVYGPDPVLCIVFEKSAGFVPPGTSNNQLHFPTLLKPTIWSSFATAVYGSSLAFRVRSVAILGPRRGDPASDGFDEKDEEKRPKYVEPESDRVQANTELLYMATFWPNRPPAPAIASGVRLSTATPDWRWQWSNMAMRNHSEVVAVVGAPTSNGRPEPVLTLWHDAMHEPWPEPDPFAFDPMQQGERHRADREGFSSVVGQFVQRRNQQELPISLTAHGDTLETAVWHTVWAPRTAWQPLPRKLVRVGAGDGTDRLDPEGDVVRNFRILPGQATLGGRALVDVYEEEELRAGHVRVFSRLPRMPSSTLRGGPMGGGPIGGGLQAESDQPDLDLGLEADAGTAGFNWHPFDTIMNRLMRRGARAGYLVVLRGGELKFVRAYTLAEAGYRITRPHHRFRVASVSKPIIATLLVRQFLSLPGGLDRNFAAELGVSPVFPQLGRATISDALRHATGLYWTYDGPLTYSTILNYANSKDGLPYLESLGTLRNWYETYDDPEGVPFQEREKAQYNNWVYSCLGEVFAKRSPRNDYGRWPDAIADALRDAGAEVPSAFGGRSYASAVENGEVAYHSRPAVSPRRWPGPEEPLPLPAVPYGQEVDALGAATSIVISPVDMARFLAAMTPRPGRFHWLDPVQLARLHLGDYRIAGNDGIGWGNGGLRSWTSLRTGAPLTFDLVRMAHNGGLVGTDAWIEHRKSPIVGAPPFDPDRETDTVSVALAFNRESIIHGGDVDDLFRVAQDLEIAGGWATGDLFDDL